MSNSSSGSSSLNSINAGSGFSFFKGSDVNKEISSSAATRGTAGTNDYFANFYACCPRLCYRRLLIHLGALEASSSNGEESLTSMGRFLANFPMNIAFAKMLILAAPLGCLEETIALCALMAADSELYMSGTEAAAERQKVRASMQK